MRVMPEIVDLGRGFESCVGEAMLHYFEDDCAIKNSVMGYDLPSWQRGLVWSSDQKIKLLENLWLGLPIGTYTFNRKWGSKYDNILIDGQQRLNAIECYLNDEFEVFGYLWSQVSVVDTRFFRGLKFGSYITETDNEQYLKNYYNMMNFSGVSHTEDQRA